MFDFAARRFIYFCVSAAIITVGLVSFFAPGGLKWGIEFEGGASFTVIFSQPMNSAELHRNLSEIGYGEATI